MDFFFAETISFLGCITDIHLTPKATCPRKTSGSAIHIVVVILPIALTPLYIPLIPRSIKKITIWFKTSTRRDWSLYHLKFWAAFSMRRATQLKIAKKIQCLNEIPCRSVENATTAIVGTINNSSFALLCERGKKMRFIKNRCHEIWKCLQYLDRLVEAMKFREQSWEILNNFLSGIMTPTPMRSAVAHSPKKDKTTLVCRNVKIVLVIEKKKWHVSVKYCFIKKNKSNMNTHTFTLTIISWQRTCPRHLYFY